MIFKINSRPLFTIIFKLKNNNFKTQDFSPLIERVLAGVMYKGFMKIENDAFRSAKSYFFDKLAFISYFLFFSYCVNPGLVPTGLGWHIVPGLGCFGTILAGAFWLPWLT